MLSFKKCFRRLFCPNAGSFDSKHS
jgi:hypothetical protein